MSDNNIDKWGSLSMPERASLISLFTGSGITSLDEMRALYNQYGNGGSIHIDPSKKGTFTAAAKRHGMGVQEFASRVLSNKDDYSSAMVRKANFARNAAKWHEDGGDLDNNDPKDPYNSRDGWFRWWYENRPTQLQEALDWQLDGTKSLEKAKKAIYDAINSYNETYIPTTYKGYSYKGAMPTGVTNYWDKNNGMARYALNATSYGDSDTPERDFIMYSNGMNIPEARQTIYASDPFNGIDRGTLIHERSHSIPWFVKDKVYGRKFLINDDDYDSYYDNVNEVYSRLNEFRYQNNLDPREIYTKDDIIKWRNDGTLKKFDLDRYDDDSIESLLNEVASNNTVDNLPENANYAAYGEDFNNNYRPGDMRTFVDPELTPEYEADLYGAPYISLDLDKYNRNDIKTMAQNAASGDEAGMYFEGDDRGVITPSSKRKWKERVFRRAFNKQQKRNERYTASVEAKQDAINRIKAGDPTGMYDYVNLGREEVLRRDVLPFMGAALSPIALAEAVPFALNAGPGNVVAKGLDAFKYTMPGTYLKMAGMNGLGTYADAMAMAGYGATGLFNFYRNPGIASAAEAVMNAPINPTHISKPLPSLRRGNKLSQSERLAAYASTLDRMKVGNKLDEYIANKFLGGNKWLKYVFPKTIGESMYGKLGKMNEISYNHKISRADHSPYINIDDVYTYESDLKSSGRNVGKHIETINDPSINGSATVGKIVDNSKAYRLYYSPKSLPFSRKEYNVTQYNSGKKLSATSSVTESVSDNTLSPAIRARNRKINDQMGGDGIITGSPTLYEEIPGVPGDTDIITTEKRAKGVISKLGLKETGATNKLGDKKYSFPSNAELYGTDPIDLDVIHETNGHASGKLAEEIYAVIDPIGYSNMRNENTLLHLTKKPLKEIPYSAEELYSMLKKDPSVIQELNMMNTFRSGRIKHNDRITAFIAVNPTKSKNIIAKLGQSIFGKDYKSVSELMPKMDFGNVKENEQFLKSLGMPTEWADDPNKVSAVLEKYVLEKTTATRGVSDAFTWQDALDFAISPSAKKNAAGPGRNSVEGSKYGGGHGYANVMMSALQFPISNRQADFTSPMDVINAINRQSTVVSGKRKVSELFTKGQLDELNAILGGNAHVSQDSTFSEMIDAINFHQAYVGTYKNGVFDYSQQVLDNKKISKLLDLPVIRTNQYYDVDLDGVKQAGYVGGLDSEHYGLAYTVPSGEIEIGSMFPTAEGYTNNMANTRYGGTKNKILQQIPTEDNEIIKGLVKQIDNYLKNVSQLKLDSKEMAIIKSAADEGRPSGVFKRNVEKQRQIRRYKNREAARRNEYHNRDKNGDDAVHQDYYGDALNTDNKYQTVADVYRKEMYSARDSETVRNAVAGVAAVVGMGGAGMAAINAVNQENKIDNRPSIKDYKRMNVPTEKLQRQLIYDMKNNNGIFKDLVIGSSEDAYLVMQAFFGEKFLKKKGITKESIKEAYETE